MIRGKRALKVLASAALGAAMLLPGAQAAFATGDPCSGVIGHDTVPLNQPSIGVIDVGGTLYIDVREVDDDGFLYSAWLYQESNGQPGLQRGGKAGGATGDVVNTVTAAQPGGNPDGDVDTCQESGNPDTLIF